MTTTKVHLHIFVCHRCGHFFTRCYQLRFGITPYCDQGCRETMKKRRQKPLKRSSWGDTRWQICIEDGRPFERAYLGRYFCRAECMHTANARYRRPRASLEEFTHRREENQNLRMAKLLLVPDRRRRGEERRKLLKNLPTELVEIAVAYRNLKKEKKRWLVQQRNHSQQV